MEDYGILKDRENLRMLKVSKYSINPGEYNIGNRDVLGFDTETYKGKATLISCSDGSYRIVRTFSDLLDIIFTKKLTNTLNFFFNLEYDTNAIIKLLPKNNILDLINYNKTLYKEMFIEIIPRKNLKISMTKPDGKGGRKVYKRTVNFYDIYQFYKLGNLEKTYNIIFCCTDRKFKCEDNYKKQNYNKKYCDNSKGCGGCMYFNKIRDIAFKKTLDASKEFPVDSIDNEDIKYCIGDSIACQKLADNFVKMTEKLVKIRHYYSPASLGKAVLRKNMVKPYHFSSTAIEQYALLSYNGGRFESIRRGTWDNSKSKNIRLYDINSAYPDAMRGLYDIGGVEIFKPEYIPESKHSFFLCDIKIDDFKISPLKHFLKSEGMLIYPLGIFKNVFISKCEYELLKKYDVKIDIKKGRHIISKDSIKPYKFLEDLYAKRLQYKKDDNKLDAILKLAMNSIYGICIQRTKKYKLYKEYTDKEVNEITNKLVSVCPFCGDTNILDDKPDCYCYECKKSFNRPYERLRKPSFHAGGFFNPIIASEITALTRCKLFEDSIKYEDNIIMYSTDSIMLDKKMNNLKIDKKLGNYSESKSMAGTVLGTGIYKIGDINRFRGFGNEDLIKMIRENKHKNILDHVKNTPIKLKESRKHLEDLNVFKMKGKKLSLNFDKKRIWDKDCITFNEILKEKIDSKALII